MSIRAIDSVLASVGIFKALPAADRALLESELDTVSLRRGETLIRQGDTADALYVVISGRFDVLLDGEADPIAEIGPGSPIGEIAFLAGGTRTATVKAARDSLVLRLDREDFDRLCERTPQFWPTLTTALASRLADQNAGRRHSNVAAPRTIALIRAGPHRIPDRFVELIAASFAAEGRTRVVHGETLGEVIGRATDLASAAATEALNGLERTFETVLFIADAELTPWSEKAMRQADLVLRIGHGGSGAQEPVAESAHERFAAALLPASAQRLVLLHERRRGPTGTRYWLQNRDVRMHHHVALADRADVDRLVRFIKGRATGLIACGGGAFCAAHVGLYKALLESGINFDIMGGTSGGSAMTAAFAMGQPPDDIDHATHEIFVKNGALRRYTLPRYSIFDHTHFDRQLSPHYAGIDIEDLWIPYFAISTNLSRYALHRHLRGDLWEAVRASGSIPGLLPPYYTKDGQMLVDGCLLDNVPVRAMHEMKAGPNVVVAFEVPRLETFEVDYGQLPSRGQLLRRMLQPFGRQPLPKAPSLGSVLLRSLMANRQDFERNMQAGDLLLVPPLPSDMSILDWGRHSELMQRTYAWGLQEIGRLKSEGHPALQVALAAGRASIAEVEWRTRNREQT